MKKRICKGLKVLGILLLVFVSVNLIRPTWTPKIEGENSISELRMVDINGENIQIMISDLLLKSVLKRKKNRSPRSR